MSSSRATGILFPVPFLSLEIAARVLTHVCQNPTNPFRRGPVAHPVMDMVLYWMVIVCNVMDMFSYDVL